VPSIFTPLVKTRMEHGEGVRETQHLSKLQWQVIMKAVGGCIPYRTADDLGQAVVRSARRRALEDFVSAIAPLILLAVVWLLVGAPEDPKAWAGPS
jgi:hypothetical protein